MTTTETPRRSDAGRETPQVREVRPGPGRVTRALSSRGLALFSETIVVSLAVAVLSIPAVTALPALAAGAAHFQRHVAGEGDSLLELGRDFVRALRKGWLWGVGAAAAFAAISATLTSPMIAGMPGGELFRWVSGVLGALVAVVLLRAAADWTPGCVSWSALVRDAADRSRRDLPGSLLLLLALALAGVVVWMFAPLMVLVPGMLVLAGRAVVGRAQ